MGEVVTAAGHPLAGMLSHHLIVICPVLTENVALAEQARSSTVQVVCRD